jgi:hypothetical protein
MSRKGTQMAKYFWGGPTTSSLENHFLPLQNNGQFAFMTRKIVFWAIRLLLHMMRPARILQTQSYLERVAGIEAIFFPLYNFIKMWSQLARDFNSNASKFYYCSLSKQNLKLLRFIAAISHLSLLNNIQETCNAKYLESPQAQYN